MPQWRNSNDSYGAVSRILHWLTALLVFVMLALGWGRGFAPGSWRPFMLDAHLATGASILLLLAARLAWRRRDTPPPLPAAIPKNILRLAGLTHAALYMALAMMPISGWLTASAMGRPVTFFGLFPLPPLLLKSRELVPVLKQAHNLAAWAFSLLILFHIAAALMHQFRQRDGILSRMWPPLP